MLTVEERRQKNLNSLWCALFILLILWIGKLSYPQASLIKAYSDHVSSISSITPAEPSSTPAPETDTGKHLKSHASDNTQGTFNGTITDKVAIIIETRFRTNLIPLILHFDSVLGSTWPILVYTSAEAVGQFSASSALARYLKDGIVQIRILPQTVLFKDSGSVNQFMTQKWLWESLSPSEHILLFQSDSMLCANAARSVDDYFEYDFIGAPIAAVRGKERGYNGGLSLRKRSSTMRVLEEWDWDEQTKKEEDKSEDLWYFNRSVPPEFPVNTEES
jgi:hypothetical protein